MTMCATTFGKSVEILLVEDNRGDADLARDALENSKVRNTLHVVGDGEAAMDFLRRTGKYVKAPRPDLILLDLNLPKKDGREVLAEIKADDDLKRIPVVILTTSKDEEDILKSYNLHANCYITKPIDLNQFVKVVQSIEDFWLTIVKLPPNGIRK
jgi:chemotaxis family two-component system response regulator Rcp1